MPKPEWRQQLDQLLADTSFDWYLQARLLRLSTNPKHKRAARHMRTAAELFRLDPNGPCAPYYLYLAYTLLENQQAADLCLSTHFMLKERCSYQLREQHLIPTRKFNIELGVWDLHDLDNMEDPA